MERPGLENAVRRHPATVPAAILGLGIPSGIVYWANFSIQQRCPVFSGISHIRFYVMMFFFLSALYLAGVFLIVKRAPGRGTSWGVTCLVLIMAVTFRLCLAPSAPGVLSSDMFRYIWDGRVQQNNINPYRYPPDADALKPLRDDRIYPNINRRGQPTIYPAGAQLFFRAAHALAGDSVTGSKGITVCIDILTLLILSAMLHTLGLNAARAIVYAWNPLVVFEVSYSGHLDGLMVFLITAALYLHILHKKTPAVVMAALAAAVKLYPALLLAAFLNRGERLKGGLVFFMTVSALYLPFLGAGNKISGFLPVYLENPYESFNLGLKNLLMHMIPGLDYSLLSRLFILALGIAGLWIFFRDKDDSTVIRHAYILTGLLLVLMPASLHPWYVVMIIPFLVFFPNPGWLIFSCTVSLSYLKYDAPQGVMPAWVPPVEYLPLFAILPAGFILKKYDETVKSRNRDGRKKGPGSPERRFTFKRPRTSRNLREAPRPVPDLSEKQKPDRGETVP